MKNIMMSNYDESNTHGYAAAASDARDIRACGCEWDMHRLVFYRSEKIYIKCAVPLIALLSSLGVVKGDDIVEVHSDECGAW
jgi:hypothetical protein